MNPTARLRHRVAWCAVVALGAAALMLVAPVPQALAQRGPDHPAARRAFPERPRRYENHGPANFRSRPIGHEYFDNRYDHGRYYPRRGAVVRVLPGGWHPYYWHNRRYFFAGGVWYVGGPGGYIVAAPPFGLTLSVLPPFYTTVWFGGVPYYYADDVYYRWDPGASAYIVVSPPGESADASADAEGNSAEPPPQPNAQTQLFIYPKNGQTQEQQQQDRYQCYSWARGQTGFDPTQPDGGVPPDEHDVKSGQYRRAMTACLTARGYSVS